LSFKKAMLCTFSAARRRNVGYTKIELCCVIERLVQMRSGSIW